MQTNPQCWKVCMHVGCLGLTRAIVVQVRGVDAIKAFSANLMHPYKAAPKGNRVAELEAEVAQLRARCAQLEAQTSAKQ